jgi:hypothetical protein
MARRRRSSTRRHRRTLADFPKGSNLELVDQAAEALDRARVALITGDCAEAGRMLDKAQRRVNVGKARGFNLAAQAKAIANRRADHYAKCLYKPKRSWIGRLFRG